MKATKISSKFLRILKRVSITLLCLTALISLFMLHPQFGKRPSGTRLEIIKNSPQYKNGAFNNTHDTPQVTKNIGIALYEFLFKKSKNIKPQHRIPTVPIDWNQVNQQENTLIWLGHSSYLMRIDGKNILVDPVLSGSASPLPGGTQSFEGTDIVTAEQLPYIDYLFISHDHYDHLDYKTIKALQNKVGKVITGLGVGAHLEYWGYTPAQIIEADWWDELALEEGFTVTVTPARHFSGRSIWTANTLWASFALRTPQHNLYLGGDSGYDTHFKEIGEKLGPFDLAILENGQYDSGWKYIHMMPEEVVKATKDLQANVLFPVHSSKFVLANHAWNEPLDRVSAEAVKQNQAVTTPLIGEVVNLKSINKNPTYWWKIDEHEAAR